MSPGGERVTAASSRPPWSLWGTAELLCYPTLQKMLLQLGEKDTKQLPFNYSVAGAPWGPGWSQRKILAEAASCDRAGETWARALGEREAAWLVRVLVPQCCASVTSFRVPSPVLSCSVQSSLSNHQGLGQGLACPLLCSLSLCC